MVRVSKKRIEAIERGVASIVGDPANLRSLGKVLFAETPEEATDGLREVTHRIVRRLRGQYDAGGGCDKRDALKKARKIRKIKSEGERDIEARFTPSRLPATKE